MWQSNRAQIGTSFSGSPFEQQSNQPHLTGASTSSTQAQPSPPPPIREMMATAVGMISLVGILVLMRRVIEHWKCSESSLLEEAKAKRPTFPCQRCQYFNPSAFLYCAVNPTTAMTPEADSCPDFCERDVVSVRGIS